MNETDGRTKTCGLIAHPAGHTLSPMIHNSLAEYTGDNLVYVPFDVEEDELGNAINGAYALGVLGLNVTVPYKEKVIRQLIEIDPLAKKIGAVNTLVRCKDKKGYKGYNTDMTGLARSLKNNDVSIENQNVIILGAGGVARAVALLMSEKKAANIYILNRSVNRAREIENELKSQDDNCSKVFALSLDEWKKIPQKDDNGDKIAYLCFQSTSVGMYPNNDKVIIDDPKFYEMIHTGYDIVYRPMETTFIKMCKEHGARTLSGLEMLLFQGIDAYELWTGKVIEKKWSAEIYQKMVDFFNKPKNIVLVGFMGSGKSTVSKNLASNLCCTRLDTDFLIEKSMECSISSIFSEKGEEYFRNLETKTLRNINKDNDDRIVLATGGGIVLRAENRRLLKKIGMVVYLKASPESIYKRVSGNASRPLLQVDDPMKKIKDLMQQREALYELAADIVIDTDGKTQSQVAEEIVKAYEGEG